MVRNRHLFQSEDALKISLIQPPSTTSVHKPLQNAPHSSKLPQSSSLTSPLPPLPTTLLLTAYLASHTLPKHDSLLFSKHSTLRRKRRRTGNHPLAPRTPNKKTHVPNTARKISRIQMLGAQAFPLERMLAIYSALFRDYDYEYDYRDDRDGEGRGGGRVAKRKKGSGNAGGEAEILMQFRTLVSMGLIVHAGAASADILEMGGGKWRCGVGREYVRQMARSVRFDLDGYLME